MTFVRQRPADGITLEGDAGPLLTLEAEYRCTMDTAGKYLAIDESSIKVFSAVSTVTDPLLRYEYVRQQVSNLPAAHLHVHGEHPALVDALARSGTGTRRGRGQRAKERRGAHPLLRDLHLPLGGHRFRPCLEDVLALLIEEFGVKPAASRQQAAAVLAEGRQKWRRLQVGTVVRDAPGAAAEALRELGYEVRWTDPDGTGRVDHPGQPHRLREL